MYFKQFLDELVGCASYLIASRQTGEAAVVDPGMKIAQYDELLKDRNFTLRYVIDTHIHADHLSAQALQDLVQVGPRGAGGAGLREGVAAAAVGREELRRGEDRWLDAGHSRDAGDVRCDVVEIVTADDVRRHVDVDLLGGGGPRVLDLGLDHTLERVGVLAVGARLLEGVVEVRPDRAVRPRPGQRVAAAAIMRE